MEASFSAILHGSKAHFLKACYHLLTGFAKFFTVILKKEIEFQVF